MSIYNQSFNIRQGLSTQLFESDGITPKANVKLEPGCWYLCIDTVCVYVCIEDINSQKILKKVNATDFELLEERVVSLENEARYIKIESEAELPRDFTAVTFNPKTAYYIVTDKDMGYISLYVFDGSIPGYVCTNRADTSALEAKVEAVVERKFDDFVGNTLDNKLAEKVPGVVKTAIETQVLFGGNSTTSTADDVLN